MIGIDISFPRRAGDPMGRFGLEGKDVYSERIFNFLLKI
ncbi:hypothetical protein LEP1GSC058_0080 [Leptospira fainei serovar Hurstbridge str. BUT 6]|uniref:Uncharacterized protein n=1 Tax=Leptospira fainei serovar Hurstbridge str. BUT 6 TaxID=1193011 RepID=S3UXD8_9LEPT|nr:hypothetical protein LEP1GSC058_0080 [Leptospira fainei serovar Hurstbridge str. BUT 6]